MPSSCAVCGAPGYVSPCYSCKSKGILTDPPKPQPAPLPPRQGMMPLLTREWPPPLAAAGPTLPPPTVTGATGSSVASWPPPGEVAPPAESAGTLRSLLDYPRYRSVHQALHLLWTKYADQANYSREEWNELEATIDDLARLGLGSVDRPAIGVDDKTPALAPALNGAPAE